MELLIRSAFIVNPSSPFHMKKKDILIRNGVIVTIGDNITLKQDKKLKVIESANLHVSAGWFDLKANFCDPGYEQKEDLYSGMEAAAAGGFTGVLIMPSTKPDVQSKAGVEYLVNKAKGMAVDLYPSGALTVNREGKDLTEMHDMKVSGSLAFTDDKRTVADTGVMQRALLYGKQVNTLIISYAQDEGVAGKAIVNESLNTTSLGLKGIPSMAEELIVSRDLRLCEYTEGRMHFSLVSTGGSVDLIRAARKKGLQVTADVSAYHLLLDDSRLDSFDSNYKTRPPLRSKNDQKALIKGLADGTIDAIVSDHTPEDEESKKVEFDFAAYGMIGLETAYAAANTALKGHLETEAIIEKFTAGRTVAGLKPVTIKENEPANLTLFNPAAEWIFKEADIRSKCRNTPFLGEKFTGKVIGIINNGVFK
jgi:dihydroorotase